jgi:CRISPR-associated protein Csm3
VGSNIQLFGRIIFTSNINALTGLHIGGSSAAMEIGGIDNTIIRNPITNQPYIPGSSLRGKMRSQTEKMLGLEQNQSIGRDVSIHSCQNIDDFEKGGGCPVCTIYGLPGERGFNSTTRLIVRDASMTNNSVDQLEKSHADLPYAEYKTEVAIDRVTSAATPRSLERVPAGTIFGPAEMVFSIFEEKDFGRMSFIFKALQLVEDDYLGGSGSRGSGKVSFGEIHLTARSKKDYGKTVDIGSYSSVQDLNDDLHGIIEKAKDAIAMEII